MKNPFAALFSCLRRAQLVWPAPSEELLYELRPIPVPAAPALQLSIKASLYKQLRQVSWDEAALRYKLGEQDLRGQPRTLHFNLAVTYGYFWLPCRLCGEPFGGHEACGILYYTASAGHMICVNCIPLANEKNLARGLTITEVPWHST